MNEPLRKSLKKIVPSWVVKTVRWSGAVTQELRSRWFITKMLREKRDIHLEIGAGNKKGERGWITLDVTQDCDLYWDLRKGIPFPDESVLKIYSSHLFEHLSFNEAQALLEECLRVLVPGGFFSICVPNTRIYAEAYLSGKHLDEEQFFQHKSAYYGSSRIDYLNYIAYMDGEHKYMFDEENLVAILKNKGFESSYLREFDPDLDRLARDFESIYAEAKK
jgi:predicted SAM-dependent methyltransferase